ncbi:ThuA domain-containing protein [Paenibacillus sp. GCM10012307]|uniref:ThuA domain-containing protein n=1 Tax=Paenibacillus roseus TaxID=2798579 RepID=A0A934J353_9BACL|nr:ThuA domain-containing protein [Paenibacillus roseus]MBJ6360618.1 ThuA domain-containing protein [Paenibacillus roseus]
MRRRRSIVNSLWAFMMLCSTILLPLSTFVNNGTALAHDGEDHGVSHRILAVTKTTGFRHASIDQGAKIALPEMGRKYNFTVDFTENVADLNAANLSKYDVVFFVNTTGNFSEWGMTNQQKQDLMNFIKSGKGFVGAHAATDTGYDWPEYGELTGAYFDNHPWTQTVTFNVEDTNHPATSHLNGSWTALEEVYYFKENPRDKGKHILLSLDLNSNGVTGGLTEDRPTAWCSPVSEGRMFYTGLGHHPETWFNEDFQLHLLGGLKYAWGEAQDTDCDQPSKKPGVQKVPLVKETIASPTGLEISKNGTIFVISLFGKVYTVTQEGDAKEILNIPTNTEGEHGLMGIALDPDYETNNYVYLYYTNPVKPTPGKLTNHLSRFKFENGTLKSEQKLLDVPTDVTCCHQAGYLKFGPDGKLYLTIGDNLTPTQGPQVGAIQTSQNLDDMRGKILRINKDGSAPSDNPFYTGQGGARDYIYAWGFRNPYRISFDTTKSHGKFIIYEGDVGPDGTFANGANGDYDEFNAVTAPGQNFGWPYGIGDKVYNKRDFVGATHYNQIDDAVFAEKFAQTKKPIAFYAYPKDPVWGENGRTALAGPVYDYTGPDAIPGLKNKLLVYDFARNWIKAITTDDDGEVEKVEDFLSGLYAPIDMKVGPDGALYVVEFGKSWEADSEDGITKIFYGQLHRNPVIKAKVSATSGKTPLTVTFDTTGTKDLDGDTLSYEWEFGDGGTSTDPNPSHTYTASGSYEVTLKVTNGAGKASVWNTTIVAGNTAPVVKITYPPNGKFFTNGETITATARASDEEDGEIACGDIHWSVNLLHDAHYHPFESQTGCSAPITLFDDGHGPEAKISWNIAATVTDKGAPNTVPLTASDSVTFRNKRVHAADFDATGGGSPTSLDNQGVKKENTSDIYGGQNIGFTDPNDWLMFKHLDIKNLKKLYFRLASDYSGLNVEARLDSPTGEKIATAKANSTRGWQNWTTISSDVTHTTHGAGDQSDFHDVYIVFPDGGNNLNWLQFSFDGDAAPTESIVCNNDKCNSSENPNTPPDTTGAYSRSGWTAIASNGSKPNEGIDGKQETRWTTEKDAEPGMWYQIDMGKVQKVNRVLIDHGSHWPTSEASSHPDYFRGYDLMVSTDGQTWTTVASKDTSWNKLVADETFQAVDARYIKILNKGSAQGYWLSIHEMYAFPPSSKASWTFTHSPRGGDDTSSPSDVKHVIDGILSTRWDSGAFQEPGQWFQVNMGAVKTINEVIIDASGHPSDYPRGYVIEVSKDGQSWSKVAENANNTVVKIVASFPAVKAQFVKITQTGSAPANWWSINELDIKETNDPVAAFEPVLSTDLTGRILEAGDEVKVTVAAHGATDLYASKLLLTYDSDKLEYVSSAINDQFGREGNNALLFAKNVNGKLSIALTALGDTPGRSGDIALVDITFKVKGDGNTTLIRGSEFSDANGNLVTVTEDKTFAIRLSSADVNQDGKVNITDLTLVAKAYGKTTFDPRLDINHDGKINIEDISFVARKVLES